MKDFIKIFTAIIGLTLLATACEDIDLVQDITYTTIHYTTKDNKPAELSSLSKVISNTYSDGAGQLIINGKLNTFETYFNYCDNLKSIKVPEGVKEIKSYAFRNCSALASVTLPSTLVTIGSSAFSDCDALGSIVIPDNVTTIESWAFEGCNALKSVTIGRSIKTIETKAFYNCTNLKTVINNSSLTFTKGSSGYGYIAYYAEKITQKQSNYNNKSYVDLGLPSGVKWATYNIGATKPEGLGNSYYWGETTTSMVNNTIYVNVGDNISGNAKYDAARAQWGGDWRLPTQGDFSELVDKCNWYWSSYNGVSGYKVYGPNGNYIFLPYASNYYWSGTSSQWNEPNDAAYILKMESDLVSQYYHAYRNYARRIRPVIN